MTILMRKLLLLLVLMTTINLEAENHISRQNNTDLYDTPFFQLFKEGYILKLKLRDEYNYFKLIDSGEMFYEFYDGKNPCNLVLEKNVLERSVLPENLEFEIDNISSDIITLETDGYGYVYENEYEYWIDLSIVDQTKTYNYIAIQIDSSGSFYEWDSHQELTVNKIAPKCPFFDFSIIDNPYLITLPLPKP